MVVLAFNYKYLSATPLILSFSQQSRLGEIATCGARIRKRMRREKGRLNRVHRICNIVPSPRGRGTG